MIIPVFSTGNPQAIAQDQLRSLLNFIGVNSGIRALPVVCDGDTDQADRRAIQKGFGNIVLTNPDMLHYTILTEHKAWSRFYKNLRYVIVDEAHQYRLGSVPSFLKPPLSLICFFNSGSFGTHVACVLRRLIRVCSLYGCCPQFVCCSATIANPQDLMCKLVPIAALAGYQAQANDISLEKLNLAIIGAEDDGSPHGER